MDLIELLTSKRIDFQIGGQHRHVRRGWLGVDCPWCGLGTKKYHLGINLRSFATVCWRCGPHGLANALSLLTNTPLPECIGWLGPVSRGKSRGDRGDLPEGRLKIPKEVGLLSKPHLQYLQGRGFNPQEIDALWGPLGGIGPLGWLKWRVFIPIIYRGETVSWTTRTIGDHPSRYISAPPENEKIPHKQTLYGIDHAVNAIVVCEGPTDVWRLGAGAVATFGLKVTPQQVLMISRFPLRAICFDNESFAQRAARRLAHQLSVFPGRTLVLQVDAPDLGEASRKEIKLIRKTIFGD